LRIVEGYVFYPSTGDACAWTAKEPELFKPPTTALSPNRTPCFRFTVMFACLGPNHAEPGSASSALCPLRRRTSTPPPRRRVQERKVSLNPLDLVVDRPSSRGWTEPCELAVCMLPVVTHRAAAQTRRRLRAGHRAEPVNSCRCRCLPQRARSLLCIVLILSRRAHTEFRLAVGTHTVALPSFGTHSHVHPRG
jgi:hypothetical protein